ncbi:MAG: NAD-dependent epimerase/dehydratase family protein [Erysipelotrichaceae bacterium]
MNSIVQNDLQELLDRYDFSSQLNNKKILVTGGTGLIARYLVFYFLYCNEVDNTNIKINVLVRNLEKARKMFVSYLDKINFIVQDVCDEIIFDGDLDYIIHCAGSASAYAIKNNPVGIIEANTLGTMNVLKLALKTNCHKVLFTSTREVYGEVKDQELIDEHSFGFMDSMNLRNCYPESKRLAEVLLCSYANQYGVNFNVARIAHSYGPSMDLVNDGRVMADFINFGVNKQDIVLNSDGTAVRSFCYISDTISGLLFILLKGDNNIAYNLANEQEPHMIKDVAKIIVKTSGFGQVSYKEASAEEKKGYLGYKITQLDLSLLSNLGWSPRVSLNEGIKRTLDYFRKEQAND